MDLVRRAVRRPVMRRRRRRADQVAVAFSLNGDIDTPDGPGDDPPAGARLRAGPPDLILLETLSLVRRSTYATVEALLATGLPVWLSFRAAATASVVSTASTGAGPRATPSVVPHGALRRWASGALAINCIPPDHVAGWSRGCATSPTCRSACTRTSGICRRPAGARTRPWPASEYAELALRWRERAPRSSAAAAACAPSTWPRHVRRSRTPSPATIARRR